MKITIKDVAREAKVATSTVSRVLANSNRISEETKERVNEAIKKLNYIPSVVARGLAKNKTRILAVLLPGEAEVSFENPFFVQAMKGISMCSQREDYYIMYAFNENKENEEEWIKKFTEGNLVDGICLFNVKDNDKTINYLKNKEFPFVVIGRPDEIKDILWVDNDNFTAMYNLTRRLVELGNKEIAFIGAKSEMNVSKDRLNGYKQALFNKDIKIDDIEKQSRFFLMNYCANLLSTGQYHFYTDSLDPMESDPHLFSRLGRVQALPKQVYYFRLGFARYFPILLTERHILREDIIDNSFGVHFAIYLVVSIISEEFFDLTVRKFVVGTVRFLHGSPFLREANIHS